MLFITATEYMVGYTCQGNAYSNVRYLHGAQGLCEARTLLERQ